MKAPNIRLPYYYYIIILTGLLLTISGLLYSNSLVKILSQNEEQRVLLYAEALKFIGNIHNNNGCESEFLFNNLVRINESVPAIIANPQGIAIGDNLQLSAELTMEKRQEIVQNELTKMRLDSLNRPPIAIEFLPGKFNYIYYCESNVLVKLRYYPYIAIILVVIFGSTVFGLFFIIQRSYQNKLWVGLAKETAHQLGTPISSLMAWVELLKLEENRSEADKLALTELEQDIYRLEVIADRFSKIGSDPVLSSQKVAELISKNISYLAQRMSRDGKIQITSKLDISPEFMMPINKNLLEWVVENLVKNAVDALPAEGGKIEVSAFRKSQKLIIDVADNGKGIPSTNIKYLFRPGFTTKKRGWGLGLSLSKRIIENYHQGKIFVKHSEVGKGTTFRIILPETTNFNNNQST
ncbi:MAG: HAMP domain-containing histidine kinase [Bacteroidia bacterium]|nr:HAMP domain-containing histidine kinase [Bacteroidia bacterium]